MIWWPESCFLEQVVVRASRALLWFAIKTMRSVSRQSKWLSLALCLASQRVAAHNRLATLYSAAERLVVVVVGEI